MKTFFAALSLICVLSAIYLQGIISSMKYYGLIYAASFIVFCLIMDSTGKATCDVFLNNVDAQLDADERQKDRENGEA